MLIDRRFVICIAQSAPEARQKVARGKRFAPPLDRHS